jgi:hypothetical protein
MGADPVWKCRTPFDACKNLNQKAEPKSRTKKPNQKAEIKNWKTLFYAVGAGNISS